MFRINEFIPHILDELKFNNFDEMEWIWNDLFHSFVPNEQSNFHSRRKDHFIHAKIHFIPNNVDEHTLNNQILEYHKLYHKIHLNHHLIFKL